MSDDESPVSDGRRRARAGGLVRLVIARIRGQVTGVAPGKSVAIVFAVALTLALLVVVTGLTLALVEGGVADQHDADVRIEPADGSTFSSVDGIERPRLANASERTERIRETDGVDRATAVRVETVPVRTETDSVDNVSAYTRLLAVGVDPAGDGVVAGLPIDALEAEGDEGNGTVGAADGGAGLVLSERAADRLGVETGDRVIFARGTDQHPRTVTAVEPAGGDGDVPTALVDREWLSTYAGTGDDDLADRVLIWGGADAGVAAGADAYPEASVETASSTHPSQVFEDGLALATSLVATIVALVVCALFIATTAGMAVAEDRPRLAILAAIGFSGRSRLAVVAATILTTVLLGSIVGLAIGFGAIVAIDALAGATIASGSIVTFHPLFVPYTIAVALVAGVLAIPYPLTIAARTDVVTSVKA